MALTWWDEAAWAERLGYAQQAASLFGRGLSGAARVHHLRQTWVPVSSVAVWAANASRRKLIVSGSPLVPRISETSNSDVYARNAPLRDPAGFAVPAVDADSALAHCPGTTWAVAPPAASLAHSCGSS